MIKSMTGFASLSHEDERATIAVTIRAVNHRFLDIQLRLPQSLGDLLDHADPDALGRLVEHQEPRPAQHGAADREHLAFAARQRAGGLLQTLSELGKEIEHIVHARAVGLADAAQQEVLAHRELSEDGVLLRHVADAAPHALLGTLAFDRGAVDADRA